MNLASPKGSTPLDPNERNGLKPKHVSTRNELDELEQKNISKGMLWLKGQKRKPEESSLVDEKLLKDLHRKMFGDVWAWAGSYRTSQKNIGVPAEQIQMELYKLLGDLEYWVENQTYNWDEMAVRLHHRLVQVHPFPNGNGRHARAIADHFLRAHKQNALSWGQSHGNQARDTYIAALRKADQKNFKDLIEFAKT